MKNFRSIVETNNLTTKPWLIIGKGPSYADLDKYQVGDYILLALNHIVAEQKVDFSHITDFDVIDSVEDAIDQNAKYLIMPYYPHVNNIPGKKSLQDYVSEHNLLKKLDSEGRLLWYNSSIAKNAKEGGPIIPVKYFSADAVVALLAYSGVKQIKSIGIDGGVDYASNFNKDTLLANGRPSFDIQFQAIAKTILKTGVSYMPISEKEPIKVYVGTAPEQMLAVKVLEYTIKKHASTAVEVFPMCEAEIEVPMPKDPKNRPKTPFSFQRFFIPELNNYTGRAIYVDSDMIVFTDIRKLWSKEMDDADVLAAWEKSDTGRKPQFSVMLMDCDKLKWNVADIVQMLDEGKLDYEGLMYEMKVAKKVSPTIEREWNSLEHYEEGVTNLLHYTDMNKQPWLSRKNPISYIWVEELRNAVKDSFISKDYVLAEVKAGNVRPSLYYLVAKKRLSTYEIRKKGAILDRHFIPPHRILFKKEKYTLFDRIYNKVVFLFLGLF